MDGYELVEYPDDVTNDVLDEDAWQGALNNAEMYGIYPEDEEGIDEDGFPSESEDTPIYSGDNIEGSWADYDEEEHAGLV